MADWEIVTTNRAGAITGYIEAAANLKYTRRESDYCQIEFNTLDPHDLNLIALNPYKTKIRAYRDGTLRFHGQLAEPLVVTQEGAQVVARDAFAKLSAPAHATYNFVDKTLKEIAEMVIGAETSWGARDIAFGSETVTATFNRRLRPGQRMDEFIKTCCTVSPVTGSWFRCDALDDPDNTTAMHWGDGSARVEADARFEYGPGTLDNVADFQIESRGLVNRVYAYNMNQSVVVEDTDSIDEYGLVEKWIRRPGSNEIETLTAVAYSKLSPSPYTVASFTPTALSPRIFDDYDVGQLVSCYFQLEGGMQVYHAENVIPTVIEVTIDDSGTENVAFGEGGVIQRSRNRQKPPMEHSSKPRIEAVSEFALEAVA